MGKQTGLGDHFYVGGYKLSGDVGSIGRIGGGPATTTLTGIDKSAYERGKLRFDAGVAWSSWFNDAAGRAHAALSSLPTTDRHISYLRGMAQGSPMATLVGKQINYDLQRPIDATLTAAVDSQLSGGIPLEWGVQLTVPSAAGVERTDTGATNGASLDFGAASAGFGAQAWLQAVSFVGTDATVKIQSSSDDGAGDAFADVTGLSFTAVTSAPTSERVATATNVTLERYLRVVTTTSGGFSSLVFVVGICINATAVEYA